MGIKHGTYIGPIEHLRGYGALLQEGSHPGFYKAQFDIANTFRDPKILRPFKDWEAVSLGYGWHEFPKIEFRPDAVTVSST